MWPRDRQFVYGIDFCWHIRKGYDSIFQAALSMHDVHFLLPDPEPGNLVRIQITYPNGVSISAISRFATHNPIDPAGLMVSLSSSYSYLLYGQPYYMWKSFDALCGSDTKITQLHTLYPQNFKTLLKM